MKNERPKKRPLVEETAAQLRELILQREPDSYLGSLQEMADRFGVGIVTVQQAARILEYEGLLAVKRGPGGGYYGARPDEEVLGRALASYIQVHGFDFLDFMKMVTLLDMEIIPAAAQCTDEASHAKIRALNEQMDDCDTIDKISEWERALRSTLFEMVNRPMMELFVNVIRRLFNTPRQIGAPEARRLKEWKTGRQRVLRAIIEHDVELARFEAARYRQVMINWFEEMELEGRFRT